MDGYLSQLSDHLAPSEEYISRCNQVLNNVAEKLKVTQLGVRFSFELNRTKHKKTHTCIAKGEDVSF